MFFFFSSRRRHTRCALVTGVQTCALPIFVELQPFSNLAVATARLDPASFEFGAIDFLVDLDSRGDIGSITDTFEVDDLGERSVAGLVAALVYLECQVGVFKLSRPVCLS